MSHSHDIAESPVAADAARVVGAAFASALDTGDLDAVARLLAPECECEDSVLEVRGAEAVIALYRAAASWAERGFDDVRHVSVVASVAGANVCLSVTSYLMRVPGRWHRLRYARQLDVGPDGRIVRIVHACEPGAAEALREFARACAVAPPPPGFGV